MNILYCAEDGNNYVARESLDGKGYIIRDLDMFLPMEYVDWLRNMCSALTEEVYASVFATMKRMYLDDAKVRIGYKHMRAGIMDKFAFAKWLAKRYEKCVNI